MNWNSWAIFAVATLVLSVTPGPSALLALSHGSRHGLRRTSATVGGSLLAYALLLSISLAGVGALLAASATAFRVLKLAGAGYLIYLGVKTWRAGGRVELSQPVIPLAEGTSQRMRAGFAVAASNPKVLIFFAAFFPQFIVPGDGHLAQVVLLGTTFLVVEGICELLYAGAGGWLARWMARPVVRRRFDRTVGGLFAGAGLALALSNRS